MSALGEGGYGKVVLVRKVGGTDDGAHYAMKVLDKKAVLAKGQLEHTKAEKSVLQRMAGHPSAPPPPPHAPSVCPLLCRHCCAGRSS